VKNRSKSLNSTNLLWTTEQDVFLIENDSMAIIDLREFLPFSEEEILNRKKILGLLKRSKQMKKEI